MLVPMRIERENLTAQDAVDAVLRENIHGLELDQRCVELAAFALALTAWKYPGAGGYRVLPELNVACSGLSISAKKEEWLALAGCDINLRHTLEELYKQFKDAPVLGSLINPEASLGKGSLFELKWEEVGPLLTKALADEKDDERNELAVVAQGLTRAANNLIQKYSLLLTNVPYLAKGKQGEVLLEYTTNHYPASNQDLATVFYERIHALLTDQGVSGLVTPQNWLYQTSYKTLRKKVLQGRYVIAIAALGAGAFDGINGWVVNIQLILSENKLNTTRLSYSAIDVSEASHASAKATLLPVEIVSLHNYADQLKLDDFRISTVKSTKSINLSTVANFANGLQTGDLVRFSKKFWEVSAFGNYYQPFQSTVSRTSPFSGREGVIEWHGEDWLMEQSPNAVIRGRSAWCESGVAVSAMAEYDKIS